MILRRHIKSFVSIQGEQTLVTYRNQPQTCRHCTNPSHPGSTCVENKKLLGQKVDLNNRLRQAAQSTSTRVNNEPSTSFADVVGRSSSMVSTLLPTFTTLNPSQSAPDITSPDNNNASAIGSPAQPAAVVVVATPCSTQIKEPPATGGREDGNGIATSQEKSIGNSSDERTTQEKSEKCGKTTTSSVSAFKIPSSVPNPSKISMEISDSESCDSSRENVSFQEVKRSRGRSKKNKNWKLPIFPTINIPSTNPE